MNTLHPNRAWNSTLHTRRERPRHPAPRTPEKGEGAAALHPGNFRSQGLRDAAAEAPICFACGRVNDGTVVGAHSDAIEDGHGAGHKAHDLLAYVCMDCHDIIDGRQHADLGRQQRDAIFYEAAYRTTVWLLQSGYLIVRAA